MRLSSSRSGAAEPLMMILVPSALRRSSSRLLMTSPLSARSRRPLASSFLSGGTNGARRPSASARENPKVRSAAGFHRVIMPSRSVA